MVWIMNSNITFVYVDFSHLKEILLRTGNTIKQFLYNLSKVKEKLELSTFYKLLSYILLESISQSLANLPKHSWKNLLMNLSLAKNFYFNGTKKKSDSIKSAESMTKKLRKNSAIW